MIELFGLIFASFWTWAGSFLFFCAAMVTLSSFFECLARSIEALAYAIRRGVEDERG